MTEYDAFGNPIEQQPLESAPASRPQPPAAPAQPSASPTPPPVSVSTPSPGVRVSSGGGGGRGGIILLLVLLVVFGLPIAGGIYAFSTASDTIDSVTKGFDAFSTTTGTASSGSPSGSDAPDPARPAVPPRGVSRDSLLRAANLSRALRDVRRVADGGRPTFVRVEAGRVDVQVVRPSGTTSLIHRPWDEKASSLGNAPGPTSAPTLRWSQIDPAAPRRLYDAVRNGSTRPSKALNYAVLLAATGRWSAFRQDGTGFVAGPSGRDVQRLGG